MIGAWFTETIGIHPAFGAFVLGVGMPRGVLSHQLRKQVEPLAGTLLVPLFFAYAGLHTQLGLLTSPALWTIALVTLATACIGKAVPCYLGAVITGASRREAMAIATLMNARGMVELILIDIGLTRGVITPTLYTILVIMALTTTLMTGPLFRLVWSGSTASDAVADGRLSATGLP
jgi:Kef-type K+ transport system membrane component KefB